MHASERAIIIVIAKFFGKLFKERQLRLHKRGEDHCYGETLTVLLITCLLFHISAIGYCKLAIHSHSKVMFLIYHIAERLIDIGAVS